MSANSPTAAADRHQLVPHLLIPFAACVADAWRPTLQTLLPQGLPQLSRLLQGMTRVHSDDADSHTLSPPHERALARSMGWANAPVDGLIPWAALDAAQHLQATPGSAWAWITPCHWAMGREHATLTDPAALALTEDESRTLLAAMQPYFATEGITLHYVQALGPGRWLAGGEIFRHQPSASLDRVLGRNVDPWLPKQTADDTRGTARKIKLLQNEMQMLLYTHPLNETRAGQGLIAVNSFWMSGTGALPAGAAHPSPVLVQRSLAPAVFSDDWAAYARAWAALDAGDIDALLARQRAGQKVTLTLCGERNAHTFETRQDGWLARTLGRFTSPPMLNLLEQL